MIQKAVNNQPSRWEEVLNNVLLAYRASVSMTTGYTPHFFNDRNSFTNAYAEGITHFQ